jgi:hypothetical protein
VGIPGLLMAIWVWTLREPIRGISEGLPTAQHPHPFRESWLELQAILPVFNLYGLSRLQAAPKHYLINLGAALTCSVVAYILYRWLGTPSQWVALGVGVYCAISWALALSLRDPAAFAMIFRCPTLIFFGIGMPSFAFVTYGIGFWAVPFFLRVHGASAAEVGTVLGLSAALAGWFGVTVGGVLADKLRQYTVRGRLYVALGSVIFSLPLAIGVLATEDLVTAYVLNFFVSMFAPMWLGPGASTVNDLVLPRMRAIASAFYIMMITVIGLQS